MARGSLWNCGGLQSYWGECKESVIWQGAVCGIVMGCIVTLPFLLQAGLKWARIYSISCRMVLLCAKIFGNLHLTFGSLRLRTSTSVTSVLTSEYVCFN
jgi:hypothetical protein